MVLGYASVGVMVLVNWLVWPTLKVVWLPLSTTEVAGFFTVRLDAAFPVKDPYVYNKNGWIIRKVDLGNKTWRGDNVVVNFAIGMPF